MISSSHLLEAPSSERCAPHVRLQVSMVATHIRIRSGILTLFIFLRNGVPVTAVQKLLVHANIENTATYLAIVQSDLEEFVRKVEW